MKRIRKMNHNLPNRNVAILKIENNEQRTEYGDDYICSKPVVDSITEWKEVDHDTYKILVRNLNELNTNKCRYLLIEKPSFEETSQIINHTVDGYLSACKKREADLLMWQQEQKDREVKAKLRKEEKERKKFEELKKKFSQ